MHILGFCQRACLWSPLLLGLASLSSLCSCGKSEAEKHLATCMQLRAAGEREQAIKACEAALAAPGPKQAQQQALQANLEMRSEQLKASASELKKTLEQL